MALLLLTLRHPPDERRASMHAMRSKENNPDDVPVPPDRQPPAPVKEPPDTPQQTPDAPVREPGPTPPKRL